MIQGLREIMTEDLNSALEVVLLPKLTRTLAARELGHCIRITDLDRELMVRLAGGLRAAVPNATVVVLADEALRALAPEFAVSSTKLVELRNPLPNDELGPPLLVFVPNGLRASAEDSFGVATFEEIAIEGAYAELNEQLLIQVPAHLRVAVGACLTELRRDDDRWNFSDDAAVTRFLLTCRTNGFEPDAMGAAIFELGLVPDFELFDQPERAPSRVARNRECVERVTWSTRSERVRALELGLADPALCKRLGEFFTRVGLANPKEWTRLIVHDRANWPLAFNKWSFEDGGINPDSIFVGDVELPDLPVVREDNQDPRLAELIGHRILPISKTGLKKFSVSFRVDPLPSKVEGLSRFVAEVISRDNGPTGLRRRKAVWAKATDSGLISFASIGKIDWEEGWHFVRLYAETDEGERVPLVDVDGNSLKLRGVAVDVPTPANESDLFYVVTDDEVEVEPPQRAVPREASLTHALLNRRFAAVVQGRDPATVSVTGCEWAGRSGKASATSLETLEVRLGKEGRANVLVSNVLANLERTFLTEPDSVNRLRLAIRATGAPQLSEMSFKWPESAEVARFREMRQAFFTAVLQSERRLIMQANDLLTLQAPAQNYAEAYLEWVNAILARTASTDSASALQAFDELRCALTVDSVALVLEDYQGKRRDAILLGPMHPLRANWHVAWSHLGQRWMERSQTCQAEFVVPTRDAVLKQLVPAAYPPVLPFGRELGRTALAVDNINPFWSLYAASDEVDPRGLFGEVCASLGLTEPSIGGSGIDSDYIAARVQRYLIQHPYVRTLTINVFNAGRAAVLANVLLALQRHRPFTDLHYDVRLFVPDSAAPAIGEGLLDLLKPDSGTAVKEADAFSTPTDSHLHPKLRLAIRSIQEFRDGPDAHAAHLSFLLDLFPAEEIRAVDAQELDDSSFVHGLVQPFAVEYLEDEQSITWLRRPLHGVPQPLEGAEVLSDLMGSMSHAFSVATATLARGLYLPNARPVVSLSLSADERALLHQVHEVSDWVVTIDRNLGIEFFDHRRHPTRPDYLIDHSPDMANAMGHRVVITSRSVAELESLLVPILKEYGLPSTGRHAVVLLDQLRSLSGRLALKLLSAPSQCSEAIGLALSRLFLEHQGVFQNQVVVPLDAHLELYKTLQHGAQEIGDDVSFRRTDLALFDLNPHTRVVTCRLVEVKCYAQVGNIAAYGHLKSSIAEQINQTQRVIAHHFDPSLVEVDRPDRAVKNRDLAALLAFYLDRSERYGVVLPEAAQEARYFLRRLDEGPYIFQFTRSGVVFDFSKSGTGPAEQEHGIEFYRIGSDLIHQLVESAVSDADSLANLAVELDAARDTTQELQRRRSLAPAVPTFDTAAFQSPPRERTLAWGDGSRTYSVTMPSSEPLLAAESDPAAPLSPNRLVRSVVHELREAARSTAEIVPIPIPSPVEHPYEQQSRSEHEPSVGGSPTNVAYDIMLGATGATPQYGLLGEVSGRKVALDLNQTHTISLFGVQGGGKSYTLGSIAEMASLAIPGINVLPEPLSTVIFHYSPTMDYKPEFTSMVAANSEEEQMRALRETYNAEPKALIDVLLLVPADKIEERRKEYPGIEVLPLQFAASELKASHWKFLMGAVGNQATYIRQIMRIMKSMRDDISLEGLRAGIEASAVPDHLKELARARLELAAEYVKDNIRLGDVVKPGRLVIVDLRDEFIEKDEALGLFVVLLQLFADARVEGRNFNKLVVFDEAHKYIESPDLVSGLIEVVREMRHKGVSIMVASQDPPSVPVSLIELSTQIIMHKFNSPAWLKHIQKANAALGNLTPERMAQLKAGEAYVWSSRATDESFCKGAVKLKCRPRVTQHGGATRVAVKN
jgi:hypothetical protein